MVELVVVAGYIAITGQYTLTLGTVDSLVSWKINGNDTLTFNSIICFKARYRVVIILDNCYG